MTFHNTYNDYVFVLSGVLCGLIIHLYITLHKCVCKMNGCKCDYLRDHLKSLKSTGFKDRFTF